MPKDWHCAMYENLPFYTDLSATVMFVYTQIRQKVRRYININLFILTTHYHQYTYTTKRTLYSFFTNIYGFFEKT